MGRAVMPGTSVSTHDLIRLREPIALTADAPVPSWVHEALSRTPWVVVRRGAGRAGLIPVGVRGSARPQRFAAFLAFSEVADRLSPEDLADSTAVIDRERQATVPALAALAQVTPVLACRGRRWGPGGSIAFEVATGMAAATPSSDLDLILRQDRRLPPDEAAELLAALAAAAEPARVDVLLETPAGGILLAELATRPEHVLVRTPAGPRLTADPWSAITILGVGLF
jgi:phosphoribosyl-dephospho-CoA transferase